MLLLVGLGNPGPSRTNNRHNIGFRIIDAINKHFKLSKSGFGNDSVVKITGVLHFKDSKQLNLKSAISKQIK